MRNSSENKFRETNFRARKKKSEISAVFKNNFFVLCLFNCKGLQTHGNWSGAASLRFDSVLPFSEQRVILLDQCF